jgi:MFS superfamily sulfate permease-like transporter
VSVALPADRRERVGGFRIGLGEASGAVADLGVLVPLAAALILVNGLDAGAVLLCAGLLYAGAGLVFRIPFPVQPLKALTAVAVARELSPDVIAAAGIELGVVLLVLSIGGLAEGVAKVFTKPVIRALQLGVGLLLVIAAVRLLREPPALFRGVPDTGWLWVLAIATIALVAWTARRYPWTALAVFTLGIVGTAIVVGPQLGAPRFVLPTLGIPPASAFATAVLLLVVPQFPLTFGNAVVAVSDLSHEYFGAAARRVRPSTVCRTDGIGNVVAGVLGGMPMCHGAGGLTAHVRFGARTAGMNLLLGGVLITLGVLFAHQVLELLGLLPVWALAAFLAFAGVQHAALVRDLRGGPLAIALVAGGIGAATGNLAITAAIALVAVHGPRLLRALGAR